MNAARAIALLSCSVALVLPAVAAGQDEEPPPLEVDVESVHVPGTIGKLVSRGVRATASCSVDCILELKVRLHPGVASRLGIKRVIAGDAEEAAAGEPQELRGFVPPRKAERLREYRGSKGLQVRVTALP